MRPVLAPVDQLAGSTPDRVREVGVVQTAFRAVLAKEYTYVSTPITSGARLYEALRRHGLSLADFMANKALLVAEVIKPNVDGAIAVSHRLLDHFGDAVISPAIFEARGLGWGQDEYMGLWLKVLNDQVTRVVMLDGWAYSNGACEELCEATLMAAGYRARRNITLVRENGEPLPLNEALADLIAATESLLGLGFQPRVPAECLHRLLYAEAEGRLTLDRLLMGRASQLLYDHADLLDEVDPAFVRQTGLAKLHAARANKPADLHLLRRRETLPEGVGLQVMSPKAATH